MNIIQQAQAKRDALQRELARIESFLATAFELQQEFGSNQTSPVAVTDTPKPLPSKASRTLGTGSGSVTLGAVVDILNDRGEPMSTRELLPLVQAKGIQVGGKDPLATLSARISQKGVIAVNGGKWWFIQNTEASNAKAEEEKAADQSGKHTPAASHQNVTKENDAMPPP